MSATGNTPSPSLLADHQKRIVASAISPEVAAARGYRSVTQAAHLATLGFSWAQRLVPCLLVPIHDVHGKTALHQIRPDNPRSGKRGPIKYETPKGARLVLDIPPGVRHALGDPGTDLWITEGARKADAAVSNGLACIGLLGVWGWRGTNEQGGKTALPDWDSIALNGRNVYVAFDSDVMTNPKVHLALMRLQAFLRGKDAKVHLVYLPPGPDGSKVGLDDYLAAGHDAKDLLALASDEIRTCRPEAGSARARSPEPACDDDAFDAFDASTTLPNFPLDALPERFQRLARTFAAAVDGVPDLVVPAMLCALATALGPNWVVGVQSLIRPPLLWLALVAPSGASKTPAVSPVLAPLHDEDRRLRELHRVATQSFEKNQRAWNRVKDDESSDRPQMPRRARATLTDITSEGVIAKLAASPRGLLVHSDELSQLLKSFDTYQVRPGRGRAAFLSLWSGTRVAEGRKAADESEIDSPFAVLFGGIQPSILESLSLADGDGLCARFQWTLPHCTAGGLGKCLDPNDVAEWRSAIQLALSHDVTSIQNCTPEGAVLLDRQLRLWKRKALELEAAHAGLLASMYGKAGDHCVRLAAVLHGMDEIDRVLRENGVAPAPLQAGVVPTTTIERAIRLVEYYLAHGSVVAQLVVARPEDGDTLRAADRAIVVHLKTLVPPGQVVTDTPAGWVKRLAARGCHLSEPKLGRTFVRLEAVRLQGLVIERGVRGSSRLWRVSRPPLASKPTEASQSPKGANPSRRIDRCFPQTTDGSVDVAAHSASHAVIEAPSTNGKAEAEGAAPVAFDAFVASTKHSAAAPMHLQAANAARPARHQTDDAAGDVCCQATDRGPAP